MAYTLHQNDIPADLDLGNTVAVDCEMMGLNPYRDRLCLVQLSAGDGSAHLVQFTDTDYAAPNLKALMANNDVLKVFHFGRADIAFIWAYLDVLVTPVYCTKIASRLARTFTNAHGLKNLCRDLLNIELNKQTTHTDWGADVLTPEQLEYAAADVLYLHRLKAALDGMLAREGRDMLAEACFAFLPHRAMLDISGWGEEDIFSHSY